MQAVQSADGEWGFLVLRETFDGRRHIKYEDIIFKDNLKNLSCKEIKSFCEIRQQLSQFERGETPEEQATDEASAIKEAQGPVGSVLEAAIHDSLSLE